MASEKRLIPTGATGELSLRVSVAALVRVVFPHPNDGRSMLALERRATLIPDGEEGHVEINGQAFGGAVRIVNLALLQELIGDFHFDSERTRAERDFRIFIRPSDWEAVRESCLQQFKNGDGSVLESSPARELAEELADALGIALKPEQYSYRSLRTVVENNPEATDNIDARGYRTVRVYRIFEARLLDPALWEQMVENSAQVSDRELHERVLQDARRGGKGRANAVLALPIEPLVDFYLALPPDTRNKPVSYEDHLLDSNVCAILEGISAPKYTVIPESVREDGGDIHG